MPSSPSGAADHLSMMLPCIIAFILYTTSPVTGRYVNRGLDTASPNNSSSSLSDPSDSPQGTTFPVIQLALVGPILALAVLLIWCFCRNPFRNRRVSSRPVTTTLPFRRERNQSRSTIASATTSVAFTEMTVVDHTLPATLFKGHKKVDKPGSEGDVSVPGHLPIYVDLPGVPPQAHARS
ncbi:hypothetical protein D9756_004942 [Leucocoprinus leucothites]|uniref:Uncharacterized protein n=1 Tax=Leucocoprinus leucothites TaxID=201217 RepID=A0A8H5G9I3_9AGAR|nr:hypothetical protein D9756_004942 [Leucoagaricus leucothites]